MTRHLFDTFPMFQSARPWGTRCASVWLYLPESHKFQSARPWGTRFAASDVCCSVVRVSIRASVGDAIPCGPIVREWWVTVSIRASVGDAIVRTIESKSKPTAFQSARPWGTRCTHAVLARNSQQFQSARPWGTRYTDANANGLGDKFQSARPWGTRYFK